MSEKLPTIKIGGREIPLFYSTYELIAIEKELGCTGFQMKDHVLGCRMIDEDKPEDPENYTFDVVKDPEKMERLGKLIRILGNAGLEEEGQEQDLTDKWVLRHMKPAMIIIYALAVNGLISEGNRMDYRQEKSEGPVDVIAEEQKAKKQQGD